MGYSPTLDLRYRAGPLPYIYIRARGNPPRQPRPCVGAEQRSSIMRAASDPPKCRVGGWTQNQGSASLTDRL